jgi:hypothetical protein
VAGWSSVAARVKHGEEKLGCQKKPVEGGVLTAPFIGPGEEWRGQVMKGNGSRRRWSLNATVSNFEKAPRVWEQRGQHQETKRSGRDNSSRAARDGDGGAGGWGRRGLWAKVGQKDEMGQ